MIIYTSTLKISYPNKLRQSRLARLLDGFLLLAAGGSNTPDEVRVELVRSGGLFMGISSLYQWIGLWENLQENPIFNGKIYRFL